MLLAVLVSGADRAAESTYWEQVAHISFSADLTSAEAIKAATDKELLPKGFESSSLAPLKISGAPIDIARYRLGLEKSVSIYEGVKSGCFVVTVYNYNKARKGSAASLAMSIGSALGSARGVKARVYILNSMCSDAL